MSTSFVRSGHLLNQGPMRECAARESSEAVSDNQRMLDTSRITGEEDEKAVEKNQVVHRMAVHTKTRPRAL